MSREEIIECLERFEKDLMCSICLSVVYDAVSFSCAHFFCLECSKRLLACDKSGTAPCPSCKTKITRRQMTENHVIRQLARSYRDMRYLLEDTLPEMSALTQASPKVKQVKAKQATRKRKVSGGGGGGGGSSSSAAAAGSSSSSSSSSSAATPSTSKKARRTLSVDEPKAKPKAKTSAAAAAASAAASSSVPLSSPVADPPTSDTCDIIVTKADLVKNGELAPDACHVCGMVSSESEGDVTILCDGCDMPVHLSCYGVPEVPEGDWFCAPCQAVARDEAKCCLCPNTQDRALKPTVDGRWVHVSCALWHSEPHFVDAERREPVSLELPMQPLRYELQCAYCKRKGKKLKHPCLQCQFGSCRRAFHAPCALQHGAQFEIRGDSNGAIALVFLCDRHCERSSEIKVDFALSPKKRKRRKGRSASKRKKASPVLELSDSSDDDDDGGRGTPGGAENANPSMSQDSMGLPEAPGWVTPVRSKRGSKRSTSSTKKRAKRRAFYPVEEGMFVVVGTMLSPDEKDELERLAKAFPKRVRIADEFSEHATHIITNALLEDDATVESRTAKYFFGILRRKWVLCFDWVRDCLSRGELCPEDGYVVQADPVASGAVDAARARQTLLFSGLHVVLDGKWNVKKREDACKMLGLGGAVVHGTVPFKSPSAVQRSQWVVVVSSDSQEQAIRRAVPAKVLRFCQRQGVPMRNSEWIFDSISKFDLCL